MRDVAQYKLVSLGGSDTNTYGSWTVPSKLLSSEAICYCVGAGEDITFDCDLIRHFGCRVFVFDPTPRAINHVNNLIRRIRLGMPLNGDFDVYQNRVDFDVDRLNFFPDGIYSHSGTKRFYVPKIKEHVSHSILNLQQTEAYFEAWCYRLKDVLQILGHTRVDLLKLDVEGAEYDVIESILADKLEIKVLCVEFDEGNNPIDINFISRILACIDSLRNYGYVPVCMEDWNITFVLQQKQAADTNLYCAITDLNTGRYSAALEKLEQRTGLTSATPVGLAFGRVVALKGLGRVKEAMEILRGLLQIDPDHRKAKLLLAELEDN